MISTQVAKAEEEARKKRAAALAEAEAAAKKKLQDEAAALAKAHAEAAAKEKAAAEKRKAEEEKVLQQSLNPLRGAGLLVAASFAPRDVGSTSSAYSRHGPLSHRRAKRPKKRRANAPPP